MLTHCLAKLKWTKGTRKFCFYRMSSTSRVVGLIRSAGTLFPTQQLFSNFLRQLQSSPNISCKWDFRNANNDAHSVTRRHLIYTASSVRIPEVLQWFKNRNWITLHFYLCNINLPPGFPIFSRVSEIEYWIFLETSVCIQYLLADNYFQYGSAAINSGNCSRRSSHFDRTGR